MAFDRVGPVVLSRLGDLARDGVELSDLGTGGLCLVDQLHGQELVVVVDACVGRGAPGEVVVARPDPDAALSPTVHQIGPVEALAIARRLYPERMPRRVLLVLVETAGLPDDGVETACRQAERVVRRLVAEFRGTWSREPGNAPEEGVR